MHFAVGEPDTAPVNIPVTAQVNIPATVPVTVPVTATTRVCRPAPIAPIAGSGSYFPKDYAPCASDWATAYLSRKDVQLAVHADPSGIANGRWINDRSF